MRRAAIAILMFVVLLMSGLAANVAVAWASAVWGPSNRHGPGLVGHKPASIPGDWPPDTLHHETSTWATTRVRSDHLAYGVDSCAVREQLSVQAGLPFRSLQLAQGCSYTRLTGPSQPHYSELGLHLERPTALTEGITIPSWVPWRGRSLPWPHRLLPAMPIWPGFIANTAIYAAFVWLLATGPTCLRRFSRTRRGLCPTCAYPRADSIVCTECGSTVAVVPFAVNRRRGRLMPSQACRRAATVPFVFNHRRGPLMPSRACRRAATLVILLLAGATVNLGAAWCVVLVTESALPPETQASGSGLSWYDWYDNRNQPWWDTNVSSRHGWGLAGNSSRKALGFVETRIDMIPQQPVWGRGSVIRTEVGVPFLAMEEHRWAATWSSETPKFPPRTRTTLAGLRAVWPGFALNTMLYAALIWVIFGSALRSMGSNPIRESGRPLRNKAVCPGPWLGKGRVASKVSTTVGSSHTARPCQSTGPGHTGTAMPDPAAR